MAVLALATSCGPTIVRNDTPFVIDTPTSTDGAILAEPEATVASPSAIIADEPPALATSRQSGRARAGVLTAGDIDDGLNFNAFERYRSAVRRKLGWPVVDTGPVLRAHLVGPDGNPAPGVAFTLSRAGKSPFFSGISGVDAAVTVFPAMWGGGRRGTVTLRAFAAQGQAQTEARLSIGAERQIVALPFGGNWQPDFLDLVVVLDTTGCMSDELAWLQRDLVALTKDAVRVAPGVDLRIGLVTYRDQGDQYVVRRYGFERNLNAVQDWLSDARAGGGGDWEEAAHLAMAAAAEMPWRRGRGERLLVHIADAPPHRRDAFAYLTAAEALAGDQVQIFGLAASGSAAETEFVMRQAAVMSGGRYVFLTDDSGVGAQHDEPTVACYRVTALRDLMERILKSELSGRRQEAGRGSAVREVGVFRNGVCLG